MVDLPLTSSTVSEGKDVQKHKCYTLNSVSGASGVLESGNEHDY